MNKKIVVVLIVFGILAGYLLPAELSGKGTSVKQDRSIVVIGSSVAAGWVTSHQKKYDFKNGWVYRLERLLKPRGVSLINRSVPGDTTAKVLKRLEKDLLVKKPDYAIIGLSLGNEGFETKDPEKVSEEFFTNIKKIISKCKENGIIPVLGSCYSGDDYKEQHYHFIKKMNLRLNALGVPVINFLGGLDDGKGHFPAGYTYDSGHPENNGHEEMFYSIVPGIFFSDKAEKLNYKMKKNPGYMRIKKRSDKPAISYIPYDVFHSFSLSFKVRVKSNGSVAAIKTSKGVISLQVKNRQLFYISSKGDSLILTEKINGVQWTHCTISHRYAKGETLLFIEDRLVKKISEQIIPIQFMLGNDIKKVHFKDLMIFRAALNRDEVKYICSGKLYRSSLEVFSPLDKKTGEGIHIENLAPGRADVICFPTDVSGQISDLEGKIMGTEKVRRETPVFPEKKAIASDPEVLKQIEGSYDVGKGEKAIIEVNGSRIYFIDRGQKSPIYAESKNKFFVKYPLAEIVINFGEDPSTRQTTFKLMINGNPVLTGKKQKNPGERKEEV